MVTGVGKNLRSPTTEITLTFGGTPAPLATPPAAAPPLVMPAVGPPTPVVATGDISVRESEASHDENSEDPVTNLTHDTDNDEPFEIPWGHLENSHVPEDTTRTDIEPNDKQASTRPSTQPHFCATH